MRTFKNLSAATALGFVLTVCTAYVQAGSDVPDQFKTPSNNLITGGQPSQADLKKLKDAGVTKIINLRGPDEDLPFDEKAVATSLGLEYISLPIVGAADITSSNAKRLYELIESDEKVLVHCVSGNRVGALLAISAHEIEGSSIDASLAFGRAAGLGLLEEKVKSVLHNSPH